MQFLFSAYSVYILSLIILFLLGQFFFKIFKINIPFFVIPFANIFAGLFLFVIIFSILYTSGNTTTVILPIVVFLGLKMFFNRKKEKTVFETKPIEKRASIQLMIVSFSIVSFLFFLNFFSRLFSISQWPYFLAYNDQMFQSLVTNFTLQTKIENPSIDWIPAAGEKLNLMPYHYFEQWINLFYLKYFDFLSLQSFMLIVYPLLFSLFYLGLLALSAKSKKSFLKAIVFSMGFILILIPSINWWDDYSLSLIQVVIPIKYLPIYILAVVMVLFYRFKHYGLTLIAFLCLPFLNFLFYPLVILIPPIIFIYNYYKNKEVSRLQIITYLVVIFLIPLSISLFSGGWGPFRVKMGSIIAIYEDDFLLKMKRTLVISVAYVYRNVLYFIGFVLIILSYVVIKRKRIVKYKIAIFLILLLLFISLSISSGLYILINSAQLFTYVFTIIVFFSVFFIFKELVFLSKSGVLSNLVMVVLASMIAINIYKSVSHLFIQQAHAKYSTKYKSDIELLMRAKPKDYKIRGVRILGNDYYRSHYQTRSIAQQHGFLFTYFTNNLELHTINKIPLIKEDKYGVNRFYNELMPKKEYFYYYCKENDFDINDNIDLLRAQNQFITDKMINFIVTNNNDFDVSIYKDHNFKLYTFDHNVKEYIYIRNEMFE